ncbi:MAG: hypothetical protein ACLFN6_06815 [Desulfonatronovibrio sp.]
MKNAADVNLAGAQLLNVLVKQLSDLNQKVDIQQELLDRLIEAQVRIEKSSSFNKGLSFEDKRSQVLVNALGETISVLEQSKKSFKSKQLECLRQKLQGILLDI